MIQPATKYRLGQLQQRIIKFNKWSLAHGWPSDIHASYLNLVTDRNTFYIII